MRTGPLGVAGDSQGGCCVAGRRHKRHGCTQLAGAPLPWNACNAAAVFTPPTCDRRLPSADEIDAVGTKRYDAHSGGEREIQRTMLELLNQLDGFDAMTDVKVRTCCCRGCQCRTLCNWRSCRSPRRRCPRRCCPCPCPCCCCGTPATRVFSSHPHALPERSRYRSSWPPTA